MALFVASVLQVHLQIYIERPRDSLNILVRYLQDLKLFNRFVTTIQVIYEFFEVFFY